MSASMLVLAAALVTAFEYRPACFEGMFPYTVAASEGFSGSAVLNPSYSAGLPGPCISMAGGRPYTGTGLLCGNMQALFPVSGAGFLFSWENFGAEGYRENEISIGAGFRPAGFLAAGLSAGYSWVKFEDGGLEGEADLSAYVNIPLSRRLVLAGACENIRSFQGSSLLSPEWSAGASFVPVKGLAASYNITSSAYGYINTFTVSVRIQQYILLRAGYSRETLSYGLGVEVNVSSLSFTYSLLRHPYLGSTHTAGVSLRFGGESFDSLSYSGLNTEPDAELPRKVDIRTCSDEEIMGMEAVPVLFRERLIKYRRLIGPVSEDALIQLGMDGGDIGVLYNHAYGFEKERKPEREKRRSFRKSGRSEMTGHQKSSLFSGLLNAGLNPVNALEVIDILQRKTLEQRRNGLNELGLKGVVKEKVLKLCSSYL